MENSSHPVRGILFDKDGTLIDYHDSFMPLNWRVARSLTRDDDHAHELMVITGWDPVTNRVKSGTPLASWTLKEYADFVHPHIDLEDPAEVMDLINTGYDSGPADAVPVTDLPPLLGQLQSMGMKLGISTSDHTAAANETVRLLGLEETMDFVAGYDAGYGAKPTPGIMNAFCAQFDLDPATVMVVGDNYHDIEFARNSGAGWAIGVLTGTSTVEDLEPIADAVLTDITELPAYISGLADQIAVG